MSNAYSFWNGQPVNTPVYPQMGDLMQSTAGTGAGGAASGGAATVGAASGGFSGGQWPAAAAAQSSSSAQRGMPMGMGAGMGMQMPMPMSMSMPMSMPCAQMGMGDYRHGSAGGMPMSGTVSSPLTCNLPQNFFGNSQGPYEPCIDNGEAFCAYNGMDMSMNYGGGGAGPSMAGGKGGFW